MAKTRLCILLAGIVVTVFPRAKRERESIGNVNSISLTSFGARVDDVNDNRVAIQSAIGFQRQT